MQSSSFLSSLASWLVEPVGTRLHLIELHESEWCPARLRSAVVETLQLGWSTLPLPPLAFSPLVRDRFLAFAKQCEADTVLDMCSGGGGPLPHALGVEDSEEANEKVLNVVLTDLFPQTSLWMQQAAGRSNVHFCPKPVDATAVSVASVLGDCRTCSKGGSSETSTPAPLIYRKGAVIRSICGALHHFTPDLLRSMLGDAVRAGDAVLFVEAVERTPLTILSFQFIPWIICYILPPMLLLMRLLSYGPASRASKRDFWSAWIHRCVFTYMFPIIPFIIWLDGFVSCLRTYSKGEFLAVAASVDVERRFDWTVTREVGPSGVGVLVTYTGRPVNRDNAVADTAQSGAPETPAPPVRSSRSSRGECRGQDAGDKLRVGIKSRASSGSSSTSTGGGDSGCRVRAARGDRLVVHYEGRFYSDCKVFDSTRPSIAIKTEEEDSATPVENKNAGGKPAGTIGSTSSGSSSSGKKHHGGAVERGPFEFVLGEGALIQGWEDGLVGMCVGEVRKLTVPQSMAYSRYNAKSEDDPIAKGLVYEIELLELYKPAKSN